MSHHQITELGPLEPTALEILWRRGRASADTVQKALRRPLKNSTVRTVLKRLEDKGLIAHVVETRAYICVARGQGNPGPVLQRLARRHAHRPRRCACAGAARTFARWIAATHARRAGQYDLGFLEAKRNALTPITSGAFGRLRIAQWGSR